MNNPDEHPDAFRADYPRRINGTCGACLYHLPSWSDAVCVCDKSPLFNVDTEMWDGCEHFERYEDNEQKSGVKETAEGSE